MPGRRCVEGPTRRGSRDPWRLGRSGSLALQFAKARGAHVLATASGDDGRRFVRRLGADVAVDGKHDDLTAAALDFSPNGIDAVLALAGGPPLTRLLDSVKRGGRVAYPNGIEPTPRRRRGINFESYDAASGTREIERLSRALTAARIKVAVAASFPLEEAAAHERLAEGHVFGKVVLAVRRTGR